MNIFFLGLKGTNIILKVCVHISSKISQPSTLSPSTHRSGPPYQEYLPPLMAVASRNVCSPDLVQAALSRRLEQGHPQKTVDTKKRAPNYCLQCPRSFFCCYHTEKQIVTNTFQGLTSPLHQGFKIKMINVENNKNMISRRHSYQSLGKGCAECPLGSLKTQKLDPVQE